MFDLDSKIRTLAQDFDFEWLLEENDISLEHVIRLLVDEGLLDPNEYVDTTNEEEEIERWEQ
jgi:beta-N-acetylglucosaminidase